MKREQRQGPYRLFVYIYDQKGAGAHDNHPFYVREVEK